MATSRLQVTYDANKVLETLLERAFSLNKTYNTQVPMNIVPWAGANGLCIKFTLDKDMELRLFGIEILRDNNGSPYVRGIFIDNDRNISLRDICVVSYSNRGLSYDDELCAEITNDNDKINQFALSTALINSKNYQRINNAIAHIVLERGPVRRCVTLSHVARDIQKHILDHSIQGYINDFLKNPCGDSSYTYETGKPTAMEAGGQVD